MTTVLGVVLAELLPSSSNKTVDTAIGNQQQMQPMPRDHDHNQPDNCVGLNRGPILPNLSGVFLATTVGTDEYHQIRLILSAATSICECMRDTLVLQSERPHGKHTHCAHSVTDRTLRN